MNYSEIVALALSYSDREDTEVSDRIDNFISIVESRVNRKLKVAGMSKRATLVASGKEYYGMPPDFRGLRDIEYSAESGARRRTLKYINPEQMNNFINSKTGSDRIYYTLSANQLHIQPIFTEGDFEIVYYQKVPNINGTDITNWLGDDHPDCYVFGILTEISSFVKDAATASLWDDRFTNVIDEIDFDDSKNRWSGTPLEIKVG